MGKRFVVGYNEAMYDEFVVKNSR